MLRLVKWAYDLGVRQERHRIASELQLQQQRSQNFNRVALGILHDPESGMETSKKRKQRLELQIAVNDRIQEIINDMFRSEGEMYIPGSSIMFPEENK